MNTLIVTRSGSASPPWTEQGRDEGAREGEGKKREHMLRHLPMVLLACRHQRRRTTRDERMFSRADSIDIITQQNSSPGGTCLLCNLAALYLMQVSPSSLSITSCTTHCVPFPCVLSVKGKHKVVEPTNLDAISRRPTLYSTARSHPLTRTRSHTCATTRVSQ